MKKDNKDHFFRGMDEVERFEKIIALDEFAKAVARHEGQLGKEYLMDYSYVTKGQSALYKAFPKRFDRKWLYLFYPRVENGKNFFVLARKPLNNPEEEGNLLDLFNIQRESRKNFQNKPFECLKQLNFTVMSKGRQR